MSIEDRIELIISDEILKHSAKEKKVKRGFFAGKYLMTGQDKPKEKILITEDFVKSFLRRGSKVLSISGKTIITPLAREMLDENNIRIVYE